MSRGKLSVWIALGFVSNVQIKDKKKKIGKTKLRGSIKKRRKAKIE